MKAPRLVNIGNLNKVVQANGNNNDDGNGWTRTVSDRRPPTQIDRGFLSLLVSSR